MKKWRKSVIYNLSEEMRQDFIETFETFFDLVHSTKKLGISTAHDMYGLYCSSFKRTWLRRKPMKFEKFLKAICTNGYIAIGGGELSMVITQSAEINHKKAQRLVPHGSRKEFDTIALGAFCINYYDLDSAPLYAAVKKVKSVLDMYDVTTRAESTDLELLERVKLFNTDLLKYRAALESEDGK